MSIEIDLPGTSSSLPVLSTLERRLGSRWAISWRLSWNDKERGEMVAQTHLVMCDRLLKNPQMPLSGLNEERNYLRKFSAVHKPALSIEELNGRISDVEQRIEERLREIDASVKRFCQKSVGEKNAYFAALPQDREKLSDAAEIELLDQEIGDLEKGLVDHLISGIDSKLAEIDQQKLYKANRDHVSTQIQALRKKIQQLKEGEGRLTDDALKASYAHANNFYGKYLEGAHKALQSRFEKNPIQTAIKGAVVLGLATYGASNMVQYGVYKTISSACMWGFMGSFTLQLMAAIGLRSQPGLTHQIVS